MTMILVLIECLTTETSLSLSYIYLTVYNQMSHGSLKNNGTNKQFVYKSYIYIYNIEHIKPTNFNSFKLPNFLQRAQEDSGKCMRCSGSMD